MGLGMFILFKAKTVGVLYIFALVFLVFDIEVVFLYPWAVAYNQLSLFGVVAGIVFIVTLAEALLYAWQKGALEWL